MQELQHSSTTFAEETCYAHLDFKKWHNWNAVQLTNYLSNTLCCVSTTLNGNAVSNAQAISLWKCNRINYRIILVQVTGGRLSGSVTTWIHFWFSGVPGARYNISEPNTLIYRRKPAELIWSYYHPEVITCC